MFFVSRPIIIHPGGNLKINPRRATVIGLGLIGGSISMALRRCGWDVAGVDQSKAAVSSAKSRGVSSRAGTSIAEGVEGASVIFLCVPMQAMEKVLLSVSRSMDSRAIVTDAGSVKFPVVEMASRLLPLSSRFVGGHPMAGSEKSGSEASSAGMFRGRVCVLTPVSGTDPRSLAMVSGLWGKFGAKVVNMSPKKHDEAVARISHLPHAVAVALMLAASRKPESLRLVSGGFMDGTRVSLGDPFLWEGIFRSNRKEVLASLKGFEVELRSLRRYISSGSGGQLRKCLAGAQAVRSKIVRGSE